MANKRDDDIHTQAGKRAFIRSLCNSVRDGLLAKVRDMPEDWNGIEIRRLLSDVFERESFKLPRACARHYMQAVISKNLDRVR